jgi:hypothetical protein
MMNADIALTPPQPTQVQRTPASPFRRDLRIRPKNPTIRKLPRVP